MHLIAVVDPGGSAGSEGEPRRSTVAPLRCVSGGVGGTRHRALLSCRQLPALHGPGIVAAAGVVNQADDKRILLSGYFTTPGLHHTTRFTLRPASGVLLTLLEHLLTALCLTETPTTPHPVFRRLRDSCWLGQLSVFDKIMKF